MNTTYELELLAAGLLVNLNGKLVSATLGERGKPTVTINCERCGKPITDFLSQLKGRRYCDNACRKLPFQDRFWSKVDKSNGDFGCWNWTAALSKDGYGIFPCPELGECRAHRVAWVLTNGPVPEGLSVLHEPVNCNNRACCNPKHTYIGTQFQNVHDMIKIGTKAIVEGEDHGSSLLTDDAVKEIRLKYNRVDVESLAAQFKVYISTIRKVAKGYTWKSVKPTTYWEAQGISRRTRKDNGDNLK